ncbi:uncharacterized protein LOC119603690 [Lucilia sericata]|uniref:uncharacterized protein LOC119603690 n=1 Tax=Lucilia sericata TaxID=13632 RepID=UPI0018A86A05|nr:uncharacterized protein LOC119603690 [Lucilia sericata]
MSTIEIHTIEGNWTDLPLHQVLYEWIVKNMSIPSDMSTIVAYIGLFLIGWYSIVWVTRFIMTIIWPLFLIASAIIVFRILQFYEPEDIADIVFKSLTIVADTLVLILGKILEFCLKIFE